MIIHTDGKILFENGDRIRFIANPDMTGIVRDPVCKAKGKGANRQVKRTFGRPVYVDLDTANAAGLRRVEAKHADLAVSYAR
jgi:hypothetical protein